MAISKYTLYRYVKVDGTCRYCKAAFNDNGKIKPMSLSVSSKRGVTHRFVR